MGGELALLSSELVEESTCKLIKFHEVVGFCFWCQIVIVWDVEGSVPRGFAVFENFCSCDIKGVRKSSSGLS
jgi:hypothetical protein